MKLNYIFSGLVGAVAGAGIAYVITKSVYQKRADEEIAAYKQYTDEKIKELEAKIESVSQSNISDEKVKDEPTIEELSSKVDDAVENYKKIRKNIEWQGHMSVDEAMETGDEELIAAAEWLEKKEQMENEGVIKGSDGSPYVISQLSYSGEGEGEYTYKPDYQKISLDWYAGDGVLAWSHNCEIMGDTFKKDYQVEKPMFYVGYKWKQHFGDPEFQNDDDCVYVRNDYCCVDFEIIRDAGKYSEIILGVYGEDETENDGDGKEE